MSVRLFIAMISSWDAAMAVGALASGETKLAAAFGFLAIFGVYFAFKE